MIAKVPKISLDAPDNIILRGGRQYKLKCLIEIDDPPITLYFELKQPDGNPHSIYQIEDSKTIGTNKEFSITIERLLKKEVERNTINEYYRNRKEAVILIYFRKDNKKICIIEKKLNFNLESGISETSGNYQIQPTVFVKGKREQVIITLPKKCTSKREEIFLQVHSKSTNINLPCKSKKENILIFEIFRFIEIQKMELYFDQNELIREFNNFKVNEHDDYKHRVRKRPETVTSPLTNVNPTTSNGPKSNLTVVKTTTGSEVYEQPQESNREILRTRLNSKRLHAINQQNVSVRSNNNEDSNTGSEICPLSQELSRHILSTSPEATITLPPLYQETVRDCNNNAITNDYGDTNHYFQDVVNGQHQNWDQTLLTDLNTSNELNDHEEYYLKNEYDNNSNTSDYMDLNKCNELDCVDFLDELLGKSDEDFNKAVPLENSVSEDREVLVSLETEENNQLI